MMFINELSPGGSVITHIDTMTTFGTVVMLLTETEITDQLTLFLTSMDNVEDVNADSCSVMTKHLHKPGQAVAFSVGMPHALKGGDDRPRVRYSLNIFF